MGFNMLNEQQFEDLCLGWFQEAGWRFAHGPDIAPEHLPRLFDRFYRGDAARQHAGEGAGLGLAITRSIVLAHTGQVSVSSSQGLTLFSIDLPAA